MGRGQVSTTSATHDRSNLVWLLAREFGRTVSPSSYLPVTSGLESENCLTSGEACQRLWALAGAFQAGVPPVCPTKDPFAPDWDDSRPLDPQRLAVQSREVSWAGQ